MAPFQENNTVICLLCFFVFFRCNMLIADRKANFCFLFKDFSLHHSHRAKASPSLVRRQRARNSRVPCFFRSRTKKKMSASHGCYQMCFSCHINMEPRRFTTHAARKGRKARLVSRGKLNQTLSLLPGETGCHSACLSGVK